MRDHTGAGLTHASRFFAGGKRSGRAPDEHGPSEGRVRVARSGPPLSLTARGTGGPHRILPIALALARSQSGLQLPRDPAPAAYFNERPILALERFVEFIETESGAAVNPAIAAAHRRHGRQM